MRGLYAPDPLRSRPVRLHWAGWETDTYRLQQAGWDLSAQEDLYERTMQIAMRYRDGEVRGLTETVRIDPYRQDPFAPIYAHARIASDFIVHGGFVLPRVDNPDEGFHAIDARPQFRSGPPVTFDDCVHFARREKQPQIIVPEDSVPKLLERLLELQQPARIERIQQEIREDARPVRFHGNIVSIAA